MSGSMDTPWGLALTRQQLDEGVFWVETAEHGGILIENAHARNALSQKAMKIGRPWHDFLAYEQEYDMPVIFFEHPEWYFYVEEDLTEKLAEDLVRLYHPEYFQAEDASDNESTSS